MHPIPGVAAMGKEIVAKALADPKTHVVNGALVTDRGQVIYQSPPDPKVVGNALVDPVTGRPIYEAPRPLTHAPAGTTLFDERTRQPVFTAPKPEEQYNLPAGTRRMQGGQVIAEAPATKPDGFDTESKLRGEYTKQLGDFEKIHDGFGRIIAATSLREKNPTAVTPASDMSLVFGFMKMLDPASVVREGEYATAKNAGGSRTGFATSTTRRSTVSF
jgi:hypothetical protein